MSSTTTAMPAPNKQSPTAGTKPNRLPAPTLFVGPPSRNTSQLSIARTATHDSKAGRDPLARGKSALYRTYNAESSSPTSKPDSPTAAPSLKKVSEKTIEAKWREMQNTLNEVEITAQSSTHVFGESHAAALDELRRAQVELARAWGRGNESHPQQNLADMGGGDVNRFGGSDDLGADRAARKRGDTDASSASTALSDESGGGKSGDSGRSQLEDETAMDIKLARERRAANESYFKKVDSGVRDVVAKLEVVAEAMRGVEGESRSLWSSSSSSIMESGPRRESRDAKKG